MNKAIIAIAIGTTTATAGGDELLEPVEDGKLMLVVFSGVVVAGVVIFVKSSVVDMLA